MSTGLIDTTEMYLRTLFELEEEGVRPLRARLAERLHQTAPTVSDTVARLQRAGLLVVREDRYVELTPEGRAAATRVMRKHRLAECLLVDVIGVGMADVHAEACRWEHVISDAVEQRLLQLLGHPTHSPFGNPIPGLDELSDGADEADAADAADERLQSLTDVTDDVDTVVIRRLTEPIQNDHDVLVSLSRAGIRPGAVVRVSRSAGGMLVGSGGEAVELPAERARHVLVSATRIH